MDMSSMNSFLKKIQNIVYCRLIETDQKVEKKTLSIDEKIYIRP